MSNKVEDIFKRLNQIKSRSLRELSYLLINEDLTHPLIPKQLHYPIFKFDNAWQYGLSFYSQLDENMIHQMELVDPNTALGRYAERLLAAWFILNPNFELLSFNQQLIENGLTLGEIDFLLWERLNKKAIHLEFALKYYLEYEQKGKLTFIGPKGRDTLEGKVKKLIDHQLKLSDEYSKHLSKELQAYEFIPKLMLKGFIFKPYSDEKQNCIWLRQTEIDRLEAEIKSNYYLLEKRRDWIYPYDPHLRMEKLNFREFKKRVSRTQNIPLLSLMIDEAGDEKLLMIVSDRWPKEEKT